ncbi:hypothetical protein HanLR1_Chr16g0605321 [Helianthus annuus]|nr:hypothetical protein HanLR1_Chr16g0605321 [Helianthus annuus]
MENGLEFSAINDEYSDVWLERLNDLQIYFCTDSLETEFVKFILARSPKLKKLTILTHLVDRKRKSKMLKTLLRAPCASEGVIIYQPLSTYELIQDLFDFRWILDDEPRIIILIM